jgi:hypothetical protein
VVRCITCNHWLCSLHHSSHKRSKQTKQHVLNGVDAIQADPTLYREVSNCDKHPQQPLGDDVPACLAVQREDCPLLCSATTTGLCSCLVC